DGPCKGESLYRLPVRVDGGEVLVGCPEGDLRQLADWGAGEWEQRAQRENSLRSWARSNTAKPRNSPCAAASAISTPCSCTLQAPTSLTSIAVLTPELPSTG